MLISDYKVKSFFVLIIIVLSFFQEANAQRLEGGIFIGTSNYLGDLQPKHYTRQENNIAFGLLGKFWVKEYLAVRAGVMRGRMTGDDYNSTVKTGRRQRNLSFSSKLWDYGLQTEFHPLLLMIRDDFPISPYLMGGVNVFYFNPKAHLDGEWYALQPLGTEGQYLEGSNIEPYSLTQVSIPMGVGVSFKPTPYNTIAVELGMRMTFTDYLDDISTVYPNLDDLRAQNPLAAELSLRKDEYYSVSGNYNATGKQRGNSNKRDWYMFIGLNFFYDFTEMLNIPDNSSRWY